MTNPETTPAKSNALFLLALSIEVVIAIAIGPVLSMMITPDSSLSLPPLTRPDPASMLRSSGCEPDRTLNFEKQLAASIASVVSDNTSPPKGPQVLRLDSIHLRTAQNNPLCSAVKKHFSHRDHRGHRENKNPNEILLSGSAGGLAATCRAIDIERLLDCIAVVESNNNPDAIGDSGKAVGAYQLHEIFVRDVNRVALGYQRYQQIDRRDSKLCREMIKIYWNHYGKGKGLMALARLFNGGPDGDREDATLGYAKRIQRVLDRMNRIDGIKKVKVANATDQRESRKRK